VCETALGRRECAHHRRRALCGHGPHPLLR
jgi:hypothetical protein